MSVISSNKNLSDNITMEFSEKFNPDILAYILQNKELIRSKLPPCDKGYDPFLKPETMLSRAPEGIYKTKYIQISEGRFFAKGGLSQQSFCRDIRIAIADNHYIDLDMVNAHPVIMKKICETSGIDCKYLDKYIRKREKFINELLMENPESTREVIKQTFLSVLNGGITDYKKVSVKTHFLSSFKKEMESTLTKLCDLNKNEFDAHLAKKRKTKKISYSQKGSFVNCMLCKIENEILQKIITFCGIKQNDDIVLCFDGLQIPKDNLTQSLEDIEAHISSTMEIDIKLKIKPMVSIFNIPENLPKFNPDTFEWSIKHHKKVKHDVNDEWVYSDYRLFINSYMLEDGEDVLGNFELFKEYFNATFCKVDNAGNTIWFSQSKDDGHIKWNVLGGLPFRDAISSFKVVTTAKGKTIKTPISLMIDEIDDYTIYSRVDFIPFLNDADKPQDVLNLFTGYKFEQLKEPVENDYWAPLEKLLFHLKDVICDGDERVYNYVKNWLAHLIQKPMDKSGVPCILNISDQGSGKNIFWDFIGEVIGGRYTTIINDLEVLTNKFNTDLENKLMTFLNEIQNYGGNFKSNDKLKSIISDVKQRIEPKGKDAYTINSLSRFVMASNNAWPVCIPNGDRRFVVLRVSDKMKGNTQYFNELVATQTQETAKIFFQYLAQLDISDFVVRTIPETQAKSMMKFNNVVNRPIIHLREYILEKHENKSETVHFPSSKLFSKYNEWCVVNGEKVVFTLRTYSQQLKTYGIQCGIYRDKNKKKFRGFHLNKENLQTTIQNYMKIPNYNIDTEM
jgi:hypothetical protein